MAWHCVIRPRVLVLPQASDVYLSRSIALYRLALKWPKQAYNKYVETSSLYPSASFYDDLAYAAAW